MSVGKLQASSLSVVKLKVYEFVENLTGYRICVGTLTPSRIRDPSEETASSHAKRDPPSLVSLSHVAAIISRVFLSLLRSVPLRPSSKSCPEKGRGRLLRIHPKCRNI